jgi:hypothetical protein
VAQDGRSPYPISTSLVAAIGLLKSAEKIIAKVQLRSVARLCAFAVIPWRSRVPQ